MTIDTLLYTYILSDWVFHFLVVILILYLVYRDNKKLELVDQKYEKMITVFVKSITDKQTVYKEEIINNMKELSSSTLKVFTSIENNILEVRKVTAGVNQVTTGVEDVEREVQKVTSGVQGVENEVEKVTKGINNIVGFCGGLEYLKNEITKSTVALHHAAAEMNKFSELLEREFDTMKEELKEKKKEIRK